MPRKMGGSDIVLAESDNQLSTIYAGIDPDILEQGHYILEVRPGGP